MKSVSCLKLAEDGDIEVKLIKKKAGDGHANVRPRCLNRGIFFIRQRDFIIFSKLCQEKYAL